MDTRTINTNGALTTLFIFLIPTLQGINLCCSITTRYCSTSNPTISTSWVSTSNSRITNFIASIITINRYIIIIITCCITLNSNNKTRTSFGCIIKSKPILILTTSTRFYITTTFNSINIRANTSFCPFSNFTSPTIYILIFINSRNALISFC